MGPLDFSALVALNALLIVGMWVRHGGVGLLGSAQANLTGLGQLTALLGTYAALVQLVLMARSPWLESGIGIDRLARWHRWLGFSCVSLICAHVFLSTAGYALGDGTSFVAETSTLLLTYPYVLMATVATALLVMVAVTSARSARKRMKYETWQFLHFYAYLAVALAFGHELAVGFDFSHDPVAVDYWIGLYVVVVGLVATFRIGHPLRFWLRHRLRVAAVVPETDTTVSVYMEGRLLDDMRAQAGQFFRWRFLAGQGWWKAHPFSLSAAPNGRYLRITVKNVGDGTSEITRLRPGTRVYAEGPYGVFAARRTHRADVILFAGGIGITPLRAILEELPTDRGSVLLVYLARRWSEVVFRGEIEPLVASRGGRVHYVIGDHEASGVGSPLTPAAIWDLAPDVGHREVYMCGPPAMMATLRQSLRALHVPDAQVHFERFAVL